MTTQSFGRIEEIKKLREYYPDWTFRAIAHATNLSYSYVRRLASENQIYRFGPRQPKSNNIVAQEDLCPLCGYQLKESDSEQICVLCGFSQPILDMEQKLSFDTTYALTSNLAIGKSLGSETPSQLYRVLAKGPMGTVDLPIRALQIKILSQEVDPKKTKNMLVVASKILKSLGLDAGTEKNHVFAQYLGSFIRKLSAYIIISKVKVTPHVVTKAAVYLLLKQLLPEQAETCRMKFRFNSQTLDFVVRFQAARLEVQEP